MNFRILAHLCLFSLLLYLRRDASYFYIDLIWVLLKNSVEHAHVNSLLKIVSVPQNKIFSRFFLLWWIKYLFKGLWFHYGGLATRLLLLSSFLQWSSLIESHNRGFASLSYWLSYNFLRNLLIYSLYGSFYPWSFRLSFHNSLFTKHFVCIFLILILL